MRLLGGFGLRVLCSRGRRGNVSGGSESTFDDGAAIQHVKRLDGKNGGRWEPERGLSATRENESARPPTGRPEAAVVEETPDVRLCIGRERLLRSHTGGDKEPESEDHLQQKWG